MTLPMNKQQKKDAKASIFKDLFKIHQITGIMKRCLLLSDKDDFDSDYIVIVKNMALEICDLSQGIEHQLKDV